MACGQRPSPPCTDKSFKIYSEQVRLLIHLALCLKLIYRDLELHAKLVTVCNGIDLLIGINLYI